MGPREAEELFELFDMDGSGGIDDKEFMKVPSPPSPGDSGAKANWMPDILSANFLHINYMYIYIYIIHIMNSKHKGKWMGMDDNG